jgi:hypothetical protein
MCLPSLPQMSYRSSTFLSTSCTMPKVLTSSYANCMAYIIPVCLFWNSASQSTSCWLLGYQSDSVGKCVRRRSTPLHGEMVPGQRERQRVRHKEASLATARHQRHTNANPTSSFHATFL